MANYYAISIKGIMVDFDHAQVKELETKLNETFPPRVFEMVNNTICVDFRSNSKTFHILEEFCNNFKEGEIEVYGRDEFEDCPTRIV